MDKTLKLIFFFLVAVILGHGQIMQQVVGTTPTSVVAAAVSLMGFCSGTAASTTVACTSSAAGNSGDLVIANSTAQNTSGTGIPAFSSSQCATWFPLVPSNSGGTGMAMNAALSGCILASTQTPAVSVTWTSVSASNTAINVQVLHSSAGWASPILDRYDSTVHTSSTTSCAFGATNTTRNPNAYLLGICSVLSTAQTWATPPAGYSSSGTTNGGSNHNGFFSQLASTVGTVSGTATITSAASTGNVVALQTNQPINCGTNCTYVQGTNSSGETSTYDHITLSAVKNGDTLVYFVFHNNSTGSGTTNMSDSQGNIWYPCNANTGGGLSITTADLPISSTYAMNCFYAPSVGAYSTSGGAGNTLSVTGLPLATDCSVSCTFIGGFFVELSGTFQWDAFSNTPTNTASTSGSNNANCGTLTTSQTNDFIICGIYNASNDTMSAGTSPITFTLPSIGGQTNGQPEYGVWSSSGSFTPAATLVTGSVTYGGMAVAFK